MRLVEPVDEMQAARAARTRAGRQLVREQRVRASREPTRLLVADVDKAYLAVSTKGVREVVERVAGQAVATADTGRFQGGDDHVGNGLSH